MQQSCREEVLKEAMISIIRRYSQLRYAAGWMSDIEHLLWSDQHEALCVLSDMLDMWPDCVRGEITWMRLEEWLEHHKQHLESQRLRHEAFIRKRAAQHEKTS